MIKAAFASGTLSWVPFIRVLARSFLKYHPDFRFFYISIDGEPPAGELENELFEIVPVHDLKIPELDSYLFRYHRLELSTAVKPFFAEYLIKNKNAERVIFFDSDILIYSRLREVLSLLDKKDFVLVPHILGPAPDDGKRPAMTDYSLTGTFNLGFFACSNRKPALKVLGWWRDLLYRQCYHRADKGLMVDQKWMDFVPSFCENYAILKHPGYDIAYWNIHERRIRLHKGKYTANGRPLRFFHFSGISFDELEKFSGHQNRHHLSDFPELETLFKDYRDRILKAGIHESKAEYIYPFDYFENGTPVIPVMREAYRKVWETSGERWGNPFHVGNGTFLEWLQQYDGSDFLTRLERHIYELLLGKGMTGPLVRFEDLIRFYDTVIQYEKELEIDQTTKDIIKKKLEYIFGEEEGLNIFIHTDAWSETHRKWLDTEISGITPKKNIIHWTPGRETEAWTKTEPYAINLYCMPLKSYLSLKRENGSEQSLARYEILLVPPENVLPVDHSGPDEIWISDIHFPFESQKSTTVPILHFPWSFSRTIKGNLRNKPGTMEDRMSRLQKSGIAKRTILGRTLPAKYGKPIFSTESADIAEILANVSVQRVLVTFTARENRVASVISNIKSLYPAARLEAFGRDSKTLKAMVDKYHTYSFDGFYSWENIEPSTRKELQKHRFDFAIVPFFNSDGVGYENVHEILERIGVNNAIGIGISDRVMPITFHAAVNGIPASKMGRVFGRIYEESSWKSGSGKGSGEGSHPRYTGKYREFLQNFLKQNQIRTVLDLGCGDWQFSRLIDWNGIRYTGYDVVDSVIRENQRRYGAHNIRFYTKDFSQSELPGADLVIIKDVLQHWSVQHIKDFLPRLRKFRYALAVNCAFESPHLNKDIPDGEFRPVDLLKEPFNQTGKIVLRFHTDHSKFPDGFEHKHAVLFRGKSPYKKWRTGLNVSGYISAESGIGESARTMIENIATTDLPYALINNSVPNIRQKDTAYDKHYSKHNPYSINLMVINADQLEVFKKQVGPDYFKNKYNIGYWAWELSDFGHRWQQSFQLVDEVWAPSVFTAQAVADKTGLPVKVVPHSIRKSRLQGRKFTKHHFGLAVDDYAFLFMFDFLSMFERKNPLGLIRAFKKAFHPKENVSLVIKCINRNSDRDNYVAMLEEAAGCRVHFLNDYLDREEINGLVKACDCYASLHRSEGFGITLLEAMASGKPVIATNYSGNVDFMNENNSYPVRFKMKELEKNIGPYSKGSLWADPDDNHAVGLMRFVFENREEARSMGRRARSSVTKSLNTKAVGRIVSKRISEIEALANGSR